MNTAPLIIFAVLAVGMIIVVIVVRQNQEAERRAAEEAEAERKRVEAEQRRSRVLAKYGNTETAEKIINGTVWVGETEEQLRDCLGAPVDIDYKALKTKRKEIWKYAHRGGNRYALRFTLENGVVVGWDERL